VYACVVTVAADFPLVQPGTTPLEVDHAALVTGLAHEANMILGVRLLDSGVAKDVSGVLQISRGGGALEDEELGSIEEKELLYYVGRDESVRVFPRGS
jgi:elongator complex protein 6